ncbi:MAG: carbohydrate kinase, partial [Vallitaleaceae bacterium]|nr:carbohydrate kinase [Vallitaleaceae bacterium]
MSIAGIDIGTTGCKCTVYSDEGIFLNEAYREYHMTKKHGEHELDAWVVWEKVKEVIKDASKDVENLRTIGVTSFGEAAILVGDDDKPLLNAMLYTDPRGEAQCKKLGDLLGNNKISKITGLNPHHMYSISKLMWIVENKPEIYEATKRILLFQDYIVYMLSGIAQIDYSLASRTMAFDIVCLDWDDELLTLAGINKEKLSCVVPTGSKAGVIKNELAQELS